MSFLLSLMIKQPPLSHASKRGAVTTSLKKGVIKEFDGQDEKWGDYCIQFVGQLVNEKVKQKNFRLVQWYDAEAGRF